MAGMAHYSYFLENFVILIKHTCCWMIKVIMWHLSTKFCLTTKKTQSILPYLSVQYCLGVHKKVCCRGNAYLSCPQRVCTCVHVCVSRCHFRHPQVIWLRHTQSLLHARTHAHTHLARNASLWTSSHIRVKWLSPAERASSNQSVSVDALCYETAVTIGCRQADNFKAVKSFFNNIFLSYLFCVAVSRRPAADLSGCRTSSYCGWI